MQKTAYEVRISDWSSDVCSSDLVEIPAAVGGIAIEHRADDPVVLDDHALVNAAARVAQHDILAPVAAREIARGEDVDGRHLELGRRHRAAIAARLLDQPVGEARSEEHTSELQSLMRISYAVFCLTKKKTNNSIQNSDKITSS